MGFNFAGMMQGLGQGLVNSSVLMNEQAKRDWEQQQLMLKLDREEHLEKLRMSNQRTLQTENLSAQKELTGMKIASDEKQAADMLSLKQQELAQQGEYQRGMLAVNQQEASSAASARAASANREKQLFEMQISELKNKNEAIDATAKELYPDDLVKQKVWTSVQKGYIQLSGGKDNLIGDTVVTEAMKTASDAVGALDADQLKEEAKGFGIDIAGKSETQLRTELTGRITMSLSLQAKGAKGSGSSGLGILGGASPKTKEAPTETIKVKDELNKALNGDITSAAKIEKAARLNPDNKQLQEALQLIKNSASKVNDPPLFDPYNGQYIQ